MFSLILRRTHMYLGLFLFPWVLVYTLSTVVMNHRTHLRPARKGPPPLELLEERAYTRAFPPGTPPADQAKQILRDLGMEGANNPGKPAADGTLTINRQDAIRPKRVVYKPSEGKVRIEAQPFDGPAFLERMHRRRGFQHRYLQDVVWGVLVDGFIVAMIVWALSGIWMWWEMKVTRRWGAVFLAGGLALFAFYVVTI